ncbi:TraB/GumN family protein [Chitinibacter sp. SCUT-21]|uniref:TraB/GumN family protein n=1 Tax=Chitinibacter sp. SCUT-21 TaxID=2970891 RepID=UPI0035A7118D
MKNRKTSLWQRLLITSLLAVSFQAGAQCLPEPVMPTAEDMPAMLEKAVDRGFLWKISKDGQSSWLYGTIHANRREALVPGPQTRAALLGSDAVAVELDITDAATMGEVMQLAKQAVVPIPAPYDARLKAQLKQRCLPAELTDQMHASLIFSALMMVDARQDGIEAGFGTEIFLLGAAQGAKKKIIALETPAEQMQAILDDGKTTAKQYQQALKLLESGKARQQMNKLVDAWNRSDFSVLERYSQWCECMETAEDRAMMKRVIDDRNELIAQRIARNHRVDQAVFIGVGSLHMVGKKGLPNLLRQQGFTVERVTFAP